MQQQNPLFVGVDVGTGSARAGIFTKEGILLGTASTQIKIFRPPGMPLLYQQSSNDIWKAIGWSIKEAIRLTSDKLSVTQTEVRQSIQAIGYDATCSLVVLGEGDSPLNVSPEGAEDVGADDDDVPNIILWLDHRARAQAAEINKTCHHLLRSVGGSISPENEIPKLKWLKEHLPTVYTSATKFLDLADFLTYRSTGIDTRSLCTLVCKWVYDYNDDGTGLGWDPSFHDQIGLADLPVQKIGLTVAAPGEPIGTLSPQAAEELGLESKTIVAIGIVDAHGGGVGCVGAALDDEGDNERHGSAAMSMSSRMALVCGTSTCHLASSGHAIFVPGVWGAFYSVMVPGLWLNEAGQSATGALLDHIIMTHPSYHELLRKATQAGQHIQQVLQDLIKDMADKEGFITPHSALLAKDLHVLPHFAGCRSPLADPDIKGMISGLTLDSSLKSLALLYLATIQALAYGTKHIIDAIHEAGHPPITNLFVSGGLGKNALFVREHADATGCRLILPQVMKEREQHGPVFQLNEEEGVLLGSAMLAATASGTYVKLEDAMRHMARVGSVIHPSYDSKVKAFHKAKNEIYHEMTKLHYKMKDYMRDV